MVFAEYLPTLIIAVLFLARNKCQAGDVITKTGSSLQVQLETTNLNVLEIGATNVYTRLPFGNEVVKVTCTKINCNQLGTLVAEVNNVALPRQGTCQAYAPNTPFADNSCTQQSFSYTLNSAGTASVYQVLCRLNETYYANAIGFNLYRLYADSIPRIRSGFNLDIPGVLTIHYTSSSEQMSCEAIQDLNSPAQFDSINFYSYDSNINLNLPVTVADITSSARNYSVAFDPRALISSVQLYKCCTTRQGQFVRCQGVYVINDLVTSTTNIISTVNPCGSTTTASQPCATTPSPCTTTTPCVTTTTPCVTTTTPCPTTTTTTPCPTTTTTTTQCPTTTTTTPCQTTTTTTACPTTTTTTTQCPTTTTTTTTPCTTTTTTTTPCTTTTTTTTTTPCPTTTTTTQCPTTTTTTTTTTQCPTTTTTTPCSTTTTTTPCPTTTTTTLCPTTSTTTTPCPTTTTPCTTSSTTTPCPTTTTPCPNTPSTTTPCAQTTASNPTYRPSTRPWFCATCSSTALEPKAILFILINLLVLYVNKL